MRNFGLGGVQEVMDFAADDVKRVIVELADGSTADVTMKENAFYWKSSGVRAVGVRSKRSGFDEVPANGVQP